MSLSTEQIAEIRAFIHSRGFKHIEVEMEILDHVASAVETKLETDLKKSVMQAIQEVHTGFGVFGFATVEEEKQKYFHVLIQRQLWKELKEYFIGNKAWPTILALLLLSIILIWFQPSQSFLRFFPFAIGIAVIGHAYFIYYRKFRQWKNKSLMMSTAAFPLLVLQPNIGNFIGLFSENIYASNSTWMMATYSAMILIMIIITLAVKSTINWGYEWTYERYLKYTS